MESTTKSLAAADSPAGAWWERQWVPTQADRESHSPSSGDSNPALYPSWPADQADLGLTNRMVMSCGAVRFRATVRIHMDNRVDWEAKSVMQLVLDGVGSLVSCGYGQLGID
jgi:hypothetical protein